MEAIKTGILGLGMMGFAQLRNCFAKLPGDYRITAICDNHPANLRRAAGWLEENGNGAEAFADWREWLQKGDFDLAVIVTPDSLHAEMAAACLAAGKHLRLEKPMATTLSGCGEILAAWQGEGQVVQLGFELRYAKLVRQLREKLPELGRVRMAWCHEFRHPFLEKTGSMPDWIVHKQYSGGTLLEKNCHHFDLFNLVAGSRPLRVYASGDGDTIYGHTDVLDNAFVTVEYENALRANLSLCLFAPEKKAQPHMDNLSFGLLGDAGRMELRDDSLFLWDRAGETEQRSDFLRQNHEAHADDILPSLVELAACVRAGRQPFAGLTSGVNAALVALAAEQSAAEGRIVTIAELEERHSLTYQVEV